MPKIYPQEFKDDVIRVARKRDVSLESIASDFGISTTFLKRWMVRADLDRLVDRVCPTPAPFVVCIVTRVRMADTVLAAPGSCP